MSRVGCEVELGYAETEVGDREATIATCTRCGHTTKSFGYSDASTWRCLALMRDECPRGESNFYVERIVKDVQRVKRPRATCQVISKFRGSYAYLSNFYPCKVPFDGYVYPSSEHAFQAAKVGGSADELEVFRKEIREAATPKLAKKLGRQVTLRADWEAVKVSIMGEILMMKFGTHPELRRLLVGTGSDRLIEGNTWGDRFWGAEFTEAGWVGENRLGRTLMWVRKVLR